jgi:magnesium transporter
MDSTSSLKLSDSSVFRSQYLLYSLDNGVQLLESVDVFLKKEGTLRNRGFWLDVQNPSNADMEKLAKIFTIHPLTIEDIQNDLTREKTEIFKNYQFTTFASFYSNSFSQFNRINIFILTFHNFILTFHFNYLPLVRKVMTSRNKNNDHHSNRLKTTDSFDTKWICYAILDEITDLFIIPVQENSSEADVLDDLTLLLSEKDQTEMVSRISKAKKTNIALQRLLSGKVDVLKFFIKKADMIDPDKDFDSDTRSNSEITPYLVDIMDHVLSMLQTLQHSDNTLIRAHSTYLAQISLSITRGSNDVNAFMSKITALASIYFVNSRRIYSDEYYYGIMGNEYGSSW